MNITIFSKSFVCKACISFHLKVKTNRCEEWSLHFQLCGIPRSRVYPTLLSWLRLNSFGVLFWKHQLCETDHVECPILGESIINPKTGGLFWRFINLALRGENVIQTMSHSYIRVRKLRLRKEEVRCKKDKL